MEPKDLLLWSDGFEDLIKFDHYTISDNVEVSVMVS